MRRKEKKKMQEKLREQVKIVKATMGDIFTYKDIAEMIGISINGFYNWLNRQYNLSSKRQKMLEDFINNIL